MQQIAVIRFHQRLKQGLAFEDSLFRFFYLRLDYFFVLFLLFLHSDAPLKASLIRSLQI
jgi:hypothetical protein